MRMSANYRFHVPAFALLVAVLTCSAHATPAALVLAGGG